MTGHPAFGRKDVHQGLKPAVLWAFCGTTEVVPFKALSFRGM